MVYKIKNKNSVKNVVILFGSKKEMLIKGKSGGTNNIKTELISHPPRNAKPRKKVVKVIQLINNGISEICTEY